VKAPTFGLHGHEHIARQRRSAVVMMVTGVVRVAIYMSLTLAFLAQAHFAVTLFASVKFVSFISMLALVETAWGQFAGSWAQLAAADAHHDSEATRAVVESESD